MKNVSLRKQSAMMIIIDDAARNRLRRTIEYSLEESAVDVRGSRDSRRPLDFIEV